VFCDVSQCVAGCHSDTHILSKCAMVSSQQGANQLVLHGVAVCYSVLQCVIVCCSVLQCVAVCCSKRHILSKLALV